MKKRRKKTNKNKFIVLLIAGILLLSMFSHAVITGMFRELIPGMIINHSSHTIHIIYEGEHDYVEPWETKPLDCIVTGHKDNTGSTIKYKVRDGQTAAVTDGEIANSLMVVVNAPFPFNLWPPHYVNCRWQKVDKEEFLRSDLPRDCPEESGGKGGHRSSQTGGPTGSSQGIDPQTKMFFVDCQEFLVS